MATQDMKAVEKLGTAEAFRSTADLGEAGNVWGEDYTNLSPKEERRLVRRIDFRLIPIMALLYLMSFLDRINIGQARLDGLQEDLNLSSRQFQNCLVVFFATYVAFETLTNHVVKRFRPSRTIPVMMLIWGIIMTCMGLVKTYEQLLATRVLLGLAECGLFPAVIFCMTCWYKREEVTLRIGILFSGATAAGAFGGILAYGIGRMGGTAGKGGWAWIFIIEGIITVLIAAASFWLVHDLPAEARFLNERERAFVLKRLRTDQGTAANERFTWDQVRSALLDYKTYFLSAIYFCVGLGFYALAIFTPTIISSLGSWTRPQSQLLSVPPYVLAVITTVVTAFYADRTGRRAVVIIFWTTISCIGFIILLAVPVSKPGPRYFSLFLAVSGIAPAAVATLAWSGGSFAPVYKRATSMGIIMSVGNAAGIVSSFLYPQTDAPRYVAGHATCLALAVLGAILAGVLGLLLRHENAKRDRLLSDSKEGEVEDDVMLGDASLRFRYLV